MARDVLPQIGFVHAVHADQEDVLNLGQRSRVLGQGRTDAQNRSNQQRTAYRRLTPHLHRLFIHRSTVSAAGQSAVRKKLNLGENNKESS